MADLLNFELKSQQTSQVELQTELEYTMKTRHSETNQVLKTEKNLLNRLLSKLQVSGRAYKVMKKPKILWFGVQTTFQITLCQVKTWINLLWNHLGKWVQTYLSKVYNWLSRKSWLLSKVKIRCGVVHQKHTVTTEEAMITQALSRGSLHQVFKTIIKKWSDKKICFIEFNLKKSRLKNN